MPGYAAEEPGDRRVARVLLDSALPQLDHLFDYAVPEALVADLRVGQRIRVPLRSQTRHSHGYVISFVERSDFAGELHPIAEIVGPVPVLAPEIWRLARAVADRAGGSAGDILRLAIPQRMVRVEKQHLAAPPDDGTTESGAAPRASAASPSATPHEVAGSHTVGVSGALKEPVAEPVEASGGEAATPSVILHEVAGSHPPRAAEHPDPAAPAFEATDPERELADMLAAGGRVCITASHGPVRLGTGEWVGGWALRLARAALAVHAAGRSVIVATPDYRDLDQLRDTFSALGHHDAIRVDARQSNGERYAGFLRALDARPRVILGNRSAVYAPAHRLGAVFLWDDGDPLLAEPLSPYVHARDAALVRADQSGAGLCFISHARSAEVQRLVDIGYVQEERLPPRRTKTVHADASVAPDAFAGRLPEFAAAAIREGLRQGPVLVQVATAGYAPVAVCADCGDLARCRVCNGPIGFRAAGRGACRWCGERAEAWSCVGCGGRRLEQRGMGSQRTVEQFERQFTGARIVLSDGEHPVERLDSRAALVVATRGAEPIAAGGYRAVILLDAERLLGLESLRAGEDCMRWWQNAAALASADGRVVMASGGGPVVRAFVTGQVEEWLRAELRDRQALRYPPTVRVASVVGGAAEVDRALHALGELPGVDVLGPVPFVERTPKPDGARLVRAIVRFDYAQGSEVAKRLRGALVADAAGASSRVAGRKPGRARPEALRLRFDDRGVFDG